jgi:cyclic pyranopterin phosphate synthase
MLARMETVVYAFEAIEDSLPYMPLAARRLLDETGKKLTLAGWLSLPVEERWQIARAGGAPTVLVEAAGLVDRAVPPPSRIEPMGEVSGGAPPPQLTSALGANRPLDGKVWQALRPLDRYALVKCATNRNKLGQAYEEIVRGVSFSHLAPAGEARMVDVGDKTAMHRRAVATACVRTTPQVIEAIATGAAAKGDVLGASRIAGILASKRTPDLIPLCHPVQTTHAAVDFELDPPGGAIRVKSTVEAVDRTGVEMEALVAASVAALSVYDMIKSADRWACIEAVRLEEKSGGKSGDTTRPRERGGR